MKGLLFVFGWLLLGSATALAYEEIQVTDGGTITGKVTITAGKPIPKGFNLVTFPDPVYCGRISTGTGWRILKEFEVAADGGAARVAHDRILAGRSAAVVNPGPSSHTVTTRRSPATPRASSSPRSVWKL